MLPGRSVRQKNVEGTRCNTNASDKTQNDIALSFKKSPGGAQGLDEEKLERASMKNRNWLCFSLDRIGMLMLAGAGLSLAGALWFAGASIEAVLMGDFFILLKVAVASFLLARSYEIAVVINMKKQDVRRAPESIEADTVKQAQQGAGLSRAA